MLQAPLLKDGPTMAEFDWSDARHAVQGFGGNPITLQIDKSGLPFYDALRLYGAIDLYIGVREDVSIYDLGDRWRVCGRVRADRVRDRDIIAFKAVRTNKHPKPEEFCVKLREAILSGTRIPRTEDPAEPVPTDDRDRALDPVLQSGIRNMQAAQYDSMNSTESKYKARIGLSDAVVAYAGLKRTEGAGDMHFLPIFEGRIDLGKIVSPIRAWLSVPNPLCAQVLMLLSLKTALWAEGYSERLSAVAYSKKKSRSFNYSGVIRIESTAIGQIDDAALCGVLHRVFRRMLSRSWKSTKATTMAAHTLAVAEWLMQPSPSALRGMIAAQEFLLKSGHPTFLVVRENVREVFEMTHSKRTIRYDAVQRLAKSASQAIYTLGRKDDNKLKDWYNEVVALRNAPNKDAFRHRVLTLIEKGRAAGSWIEPFDPEALFDSMGDDSDRPSFEAFRDCFRMYMIQESAPKSPAPDLDDDGPIDTESDGEEEGDE
jgi:hypothetical protein